MFSRFIAVLGVLSALTSLFSCRTAPLVRSHPLKIENVQHLVLATKSDQVYFEERIKKNILPPLVVSRALIRVDGTISVDYYLDLKADSVNVRFENETKIVHFAGGPIRVKKPVILSAKVFILEKGIWVNEEKEARHILEHLTDRLETFGEGWIKDESLRRHCETSLRDFLMRLGREQGHAVAEAKIHLRK